MTEYIFLRYANQPNPQVSAALVPIVKRGTNVPFTALPGVMITGFKSDLTESEIRGKLDRLDIIYDLVIKRNTVSAAPRTAPQTGAKTKEQFETEIQSAIDVEDFETATRLRDEMNVAYPETPTDTIESMITNIVEFRAVYEAATRINENNNDDDYDQLYDSYEDMSYSVDGSPTKDVFIEAAKKEGQEWINDWSDSYNGHDAYEEDLDDSDRKYWSMLDAFIKKNNYPVD